MSIILVLCMLLCYRFGHEINYYLTLWGTLTCVAISLRDIFRIILGLLNVLQLYLLHKHISIKKHTEQFVLQFYW